MKKHGFYPSCFRKQGYLFKAPKEIMFRGSEYSYPKKSFVKVNLFKQNCFTKLSRSMGGGKLVDGSRFRSWGIINHFIEEDNPGIYVFYKSVANTIQENNKNKKDKPQTKSLALPTTGRYLVLPSALKA